MNLRSIVENDDELPQDVVAQFLDQLEVEQSQAQAQDVKSQDGDVLESQIDGTSIIVTDPQSAKNNFIFTKEENDFLKNILINGDASIEMPLDNDGPVDIALAIARHTEKKRYVVKVSLNFDNYDAIKRLQYTFGSMSSNWDQFLRNEYSLYCEKDKSANIRNAVFIPNPYVHHAFLLAQKIISFRNIKSENIFFYEVSDDEVVTGLDDDFLINHKQYTYAEVENVVKFECYDKILIKFNKFNCIDKTDFGSTLGNTLRKFTDLKYSSSNSNNEYQGVISGLVNPLPISLNNLYSLNIINYDLNRLANNYNIEFSVTLFKKPKQNKMHAPIIEPQRKKQRTGESVPMIPNSANLGIAMNLNSIFQNPNLSPSLKSQLQTLQRMKK